MIKKINNFTRKSFKGYTGPNNEFNKKNIIFGYNGRGKSSLAIGIFEEYVKDNPVENARIYNEQYIENNLILKDDKDKLKGVVANFGEKDVEIERQIQELENEITNNTELESEIKELNRITRIHIDTIHDERKGNAKISKKNLSFTLKKVLESYKKDLYEAKKLGVTDEELEKTFGDDSLARNLELLNKIEIGTIKKFNKREEWDNILATCVEPYKVIEIPSQEIISWLNEGVHLHTEGDNCKFCDAPINFQLIKTKIDNYNASELQKTINKLTNFKNELIDYILEINEFLENKRHVFSILNKNEVEAYYESIDKLKSDLLEVVNCLQEKIESMDKSIKPEEKIDLEFTEILDNINENVKDVKNNHYDKQEELRKLIENQDQLVKGAIAFKLQNDSLIDENISKIERKKLEFEDNYNKNKEINKKINELNNSKTTIGEFANVLSTVLMNLGINIEIILDKTEKNYILKHALSEELLTVEDISEGEKNLLSLLFFYYELFDDDKQQNFKDEIEIVVIDDPISSLDNANRFYVLELIKSLIDINEVQIFILTHVWDDFSDLCYGKKEGENSPYAFFEVFKTQNGESDIRSKKPHARPYQMLFKEIYDFSEKSKNQELNHCEIYHLPNSMRKVFEEYLSFKSSKSIIPTQSNKIKIEKIMDITSNSQKNKLNNLLMICNVLSHRASYNPEEILNAAKFLMSIIEVHDKKHYLAMRGTN